MSTTPNMSLVVPEVLVTTGPAYATQINAALDVIDAHDHSSGKGVRVTPSGLNINADLPFGNNQATNVKAVALSQQASVATNAAIYNLGGDLYYRRGDGTEIRITTAAGVNVSGVGGITGLTSPAAATYTPAALSFGWLSDASTFAKQATGDILLYSRAGAIGVVQAVTLVADVATSAYSLRLPATAPTDNQLMRMKAATAGAFVDLLGTNNQVIVTHTTPAITLSLPQDIHTGASPTFVGLTLSGAVTGITSLSAATITASGNVSLTGPVASTLNAVNYSADFDVVQANVLKSNLIMQKSGTFTAVTSELRATGGLKADNISSVSGGAITVANGLSMGFASIAAGAISGTALTASASMATPTINIATGATIINSLGATINALTCSTINSPTGVEIAGRLSTTPYPAFTVGEIVTASPASSVASSNSFQNIVSISLTPGVWEVSANVQFLWNGFDQNSMRMRKLETAISLSSAAVDDQKYGNCQFFPLYGWGEFSSNTVDRGQTITSGEFVQISLLSRRIQVSSTTTVYLVGRSAVYAGGFPTDCRYTSTGTILKAQRVG